MMTIFAYACCQRGEREREREQRQQELRQKLAKSLADCDVVNSVADFDEQLDLYHKSYPTLDSE